MKKFILLKEVKASVSYKFEGDPDSHFMICSRKAWDIKMLIQKLRFEYPIKFHKIGTDIFDETNPLFKEYEADLQKLQHLSYSEGLDDNEEE